MLVMLLLLLSVRQGMKGVMEKLDSFVSTYFKNEIHAIIRRLCEIQSAITSNMQLNIASAKLFRLFQI